MRRRLLIALGVLVLAGILLAVAWTQKSLPLLLLGTAGLVAVGAVALPRLATAAMVLVAVLGSLAVVEWGLGIALGGATTAVYEPPGYYRSIDLGHGPTPGVYTARRSATTGEMIYEAVYTIGDDGFRVTPGPPAEPVGRVNLFGGSFTFGEGVDDDQTLAAFLAGELGEVSVKNFGVHGYGLNQAVAILESDRDTSGDVNVLLTFTGHAVRSACRTTYQIGAPRYEIGPEGDAVRAGHCLESLDSPLGSPLKRSHILDLILKVRAEQGAEDDMHLYAALIQKFITLSEARDQAAIIAFLPNMGYSEFHEEEQAALMERLRGQGRDVADVTLLDDAGRLDPSFVLHPEDTHPSAAAHAARARLLVDHLRDR